MVPERNLLQFKEKPFDQISQLTGDPSIPVRSRS